MEEEKVRNLVAENRPLHGCVSTVDDAVSELAGSALQLIPRCA